MRLLLDTNILIDYYTVRMPYFEELTGLVVAREFGDIEIWASGKSYTDIFYVARKRFDEHELQRAFLDSFEMIDLCSIEPEDIKLAAELSWDDFEDCLIFVAAQKIKADAIVTRDVGGFSHSSIPAVCPLEALKLIEEEEGFVYEELDLSCLDVSI